MFKSHILGSPTIISMDPELNRYVLLNEAKGLVPGYPQSMLDILGKRNISAVHGATHKHMRGNIMSLVGPQAVKDRLLPRINTYMKLHLSNWDDKVVDLQAKALEVIKLCANVDPILKRFDVYKLLIKLFFFRCNFL